MIRTILPVGKDVSTFHEKQPAIINANNSPAIIKIIAVKPRFNLGFTSKVDLEMALVALAVLVEVP